ncbi:hypothetical protein [Microbacterium sp. 1P10AE]|uniref:hypothetical protein n=1 Tax=Microbacterium sp. 1P10AE TaxID=3132286 RepID=UPI0039A3C226
MPTDDRVAREGDPEKEVSGMRENDVRPVRTEARCGFPWCTTLHGETAHPDDEAHRSAGVGFTARVRSVDETGAGAEADVEVGILRRLDDDEDWLVVEVAGEGLAFGRDGVRQLRRILVENPQIREAFLC